MTKHLIMINGRSTAGKDTFVSTVISAVVTHHPYLVTDNISSVQPIKNIIAELGLEDPEKGQDYRQLLVDIKVALNKYRRSADLFAIDAVRRSMAGHSEAIVFLHVREPESLQFIFKNAPFNWKVSSVWVERPDAPAVANDSTYDAYPYDFLITNNGSLDELKAQAIEFAKKFED